MVGRLIDPTCRLSLGTVLELPSIVSIRPLPPRGYPLSAAGTSAIRVPSASSAASDCRRDVTSTCARSIDCRRRIAIADFSPDDRRGASDRSDEMRQHTPAVYPPVDPFGPGGPDSRRR